MHSLQAHAISGIDKNELIALLIELALKKQRAVFDDRDNSGVCLILLALACPALVYTGVKNRLKFSQRGGVCKDDVPQGRSIDLSHRIENSVAPPLANRLLDAVALQRLVGQRIRINDCTAELRE